MPESNSGPGNNARVDPGLRKRLKRGNINAKTFLATDYLNHFNEIVMLIEMIPELPDCLEDAREWRPKSYIEHFEASNFSDKALAIEAYRTAPHRAREALDAIAHRLNGKITALLAEIEKLAAARRMGECAALIRLSAPDLRHMIHLASAVINGTGGEASASPVAEGGGDSDQAAVDRLF